MAKKPVASLQSLILKRSALGPPKPKAKPVDKLFKPEQDFPQFKTFEYKRRHSGGFRLSLPSNTLKASQQWTSTIHAVNKQVFGHIEFKGMQEEIINAVLSGEDALVIMPTGAGKSLTYQLPSVITKGITIVVEPLLSLMNDQVSKLLELGIKTRQLISSQSVAEQSRIYIELENYHLIKLLYITPEKLAKSDRLHDTLNSLYRAGLIARLVIDEAHCVSQWGTDFRPDYLKLKNFRSDFPNVPILALTASAPPSLQLDISKLLTLSEPVLFNSGFNRRNLYYEVRAKTSNINSDIARFIINKHNNESGIIYCNFVKDCEFLSKVLKHNYKISCGYYHAGLTNDRKEEVYAKWISGEMKVIVATVAFGLGIDKKNVRFVVHYSINESLELYYQETGRAGRDGLRSDCLLFYQYQDKTKVENLVSNARAKDIYKVIEYCENFFVCRRKTLLDHLGESFDARDCEQMCDNCTNRVDCVEVNVSSYAEAVVSDMIKDRRKSFTILQLAELLKGSNSRVQSHLKGYTSFGILKNWSKSNIDRFLRMLICMNVLIEEKVSLKFGGSFHRLHPCANMTQAKEILMKFREGYAHGEEPDSPQDESGELIERLRLTRKKIGKIEKLQEQLIISDAEIENLGKSLNISSEAIHPEIRKEIERYLAAKAAEKPVFSLDLNLIEDFVAEDPTLKRKLEKAGFPSKELKK